MNWLVPILTFVIAIWLSVFLARLLERNRTGWTDRRRAWVAASVLPAFILFLTFVGMAWILIGPGPRKGLLDLWLVVTAALGAVCAAVALVGGLVGASFARRGRGE